MVLLILGNPHFKRFSSSTIVMGSRIRIQYFSPRGLEVLGLEMKVRGACLSLALARTDHFQMGCGSFCRWGGFNIYTKR